MNTLELQKMANEVRKGIVTAVHGAKAGHPGGSLSAADVFTYLYFEEMNIDPKDPKKADRDRFVLSKGHTAPGLYSALAHRGYFPVEDLPTLRHLGSYLQGHPCMQEVPGTDMSSGSLGQGISAAVGMALSAKLSDEKWRVYTLLGDGEIEEGQVWEASMFAGFHKLDNLCVIVDNNNLQIDGAISEVCSPYPIDKKNLAQVKPYGTVNVRFNTAGNKLDPTAFRVADIYETSVCPLARVMRTELRKLGVDSLKVVYSKEIPVKATAGEEYGRHAPGSVSFVPSVAGLIIAGEVIKDLTGVRGGVRGDG